MLDNLKTLGLVWIPGLMAGLLLAGASPHDAARLQVLLFAMLLVAGLGCALPSTRWLENDVLLVSAAGAGGPSSLPMPKPF